MLVVGPSSGHPTPDLGACRCKLRTFRAEITTLGGRVRIDAVLGSEEDAPDNKLPKDVCNAVRDALTAVVEKSSQVTGVSWPESKRQKTANAQAVSAS